MARAYFRLFFDQYHPLVSKLSDEEAGRVFKALLDYTKYGVLPDLPGREEIVWPLMQEDIDRDRASYEKKCKTNAANSQKALEKRKQKETDSDPAAPTGTDWVPTSPTGTQSKEAKEANKSNQAKKSNYAYEAKQAQEAQQANELPPSSRKPGESDSAYLARVRKLLLEDSVREKRNLPQTQQVPTHIYAFQG